MRQKLIMIIDDDHDDTDLFCEVAESLQEQCRCIMKSSCDDALHYLKENFSEQPDIIFLDINMPRISGKECLAILKKNPLVKNIPVYIYSTSKEKKEKEAMMKAGADYFITKPDSYTELKNILLELLRANQPSRI